MKISSGLAHWREEVGWGTQQSHLSYELLESLTTEVGPRLPGTENDKKAVAWAKAKFKSKALHKWTSVMLSIPPLHAMRIGELLCFQFHWAICSSNFLSKKDYKLFKKVCRAPWWAEAISVSVMPESESKLSWKDGSENVALISAPNLGKRLSITPNAPIPPLFPGAVDINNTFLSKRNLRSKRESQSNTFLWWNRNINYLCKIIFSLNI